MCQYVQNINAGGGKWVYPAMCMVRKGRLVTLQISYLVFVISVRKKLTGKRIPDALSIVHWIDFLSWMLTSRFVLLGERWRALNYRIHAEKGQLARNLNLRLLDRLPGHYCPYSSAMGGCDPASNGTLDHDGNE